MRAYHSSALHSFIMSGEIIISMTILPLSGDPRHPK
jgi:hypothetical protein